MTAGQLAELSGLTTGAVTGLVDRLEKSGFVKRERDPKDRRKVVINPQVDKMEQEISPPLRRYEPTDGAVDDRL